MMGLVWREAGLLVSLSFANPLFLLPLSLLPLHPELAGKLCRLSRHSRFCLSF